MKKKIIFIQYLKFLDFHYERYEIAYLKKFFQVEIHDLSYIFNKKSHQNYNYIRQKHKVLKFYDLNSWSKKIDKDHKVFRENLFLFSEGSPLNFKLLLFCIYFLRKNINFAFLQLAALPRLNIYRDYSFKENLYYKIHRIFMRNRHVFYDFRVSIISRLIKFISLIYPPKIIFTNGKIDLNILKKNFPKTKIISLNSWDCSKIFIKKKVDYTIGRKFGVYLTPCSNKSAGDSSAYGYKRLEDVKKVFRYVNFGLNKIEKKYKTKIIIALHPRGEENIKRFKNLGNRETFKYKTMELIKNSEFVITHGSIATAYAVLFYKPILFISTKESNQNLFFIRFNKKMAEFFQAKFIDINDFRNIEVPDKISISKKSKRKYNYFKNNYLLSNSFKKTPNYLIIKKILNNF